MSQAEPTSRRRASCSVVGCLLVIGVVVAVVAGAFALSNGGQPFADRHLWAPHDVVREYLAAFVAGDIDQARLLVCEDIKNAGLPDPAAPVGNPRSWTAAVEDEFPYPRSEGRVAIYYRVTSGDGDWRAQALLEREEGGWRICAFET